MANLNSENLLNGVDEPLVAMIAAVIWWQWPDKEGNREMVLGYHHPCTAG